MDDIAARWEQFDSEYLEFDRIENKRSERSDLHAFLLLDEIFPGTENIVDVANHDNLLLFPDLEQINSLTDDQIIELVRCGVSYREYYESLRVGV